jgi:integrase
MICLYKRKSRSTGKPLKAWYCHFRVPMADGKWKQIHRSTGQTDQTEAMRHALDFERTERVSAGAGNEKSKRIMRLVDEAASLAMRGLLNHDKGREIVNAILVIGTGTPAVDYTIAAWCDDWLAGKKATAKPGTYLRYENAIKRLKAHLKGKADQRLESLTKRDIEEFRDDLRKGGRAAKTVNGYVKDVRSCLRAAAREGLLVRNPASNVEHLAEDDSVSREPFSIQEVAQLVAKAPSDDWKGMVLLGAYGGIRLGDAARLKAGNVDLVEKLIRFMPAKSSRKKKVVTLPMHPEVEGFLLDHPLSDDPAAPLFPSLAKRSVAGRNGLSLTFAAIMETAGVSRGVAKETADGAGRVQYTRSFHALRHTFNSLLAGVDVAQETRMKLTGHSTREVNDIYTHSDVQALRKALEKMPHLTTNQSANDAET